MEALSTYDRNRDGVVSALEAHDYAKEKTWTYTQGRQRPTAHARFIGDADIALAGRKQRDGLPVLEAYDERLAGFALQVNGQAKGVLPFAFPLSDGGGSEIALYAPGDDQPLARYHVSAAAGDTLTLRQVMTERPLEFTVRQRYQWWRDAAWRRLSGSDHADATMMAAAYGIGMWNLGISNEWTRPQKNDIAPFIDTEVAVRSLLLRLGYRYALPRLALAATLATGQEQVSISLIDTTGTDRLHFRDRAWARGLELAAIYELGVDVSLLLDAGVRRNTWRLDELGALDGQRRWLGLGVEYRFGWHARSLR